MYQLRISTLRTPEALKDYVRRAHPLVLAVNSVVERAPDVASSASCRLWN
jgi:hypothetical protein